MELILRKAEFYDPIRLGLSGYLSVWKMGGMMREEAERCIKIQTKRVLILLDLRSISQPELEIQLLDRVIIEYLVSSITRKGCEEETCRRGLSSHPLVAVGRLVIDSFISPNAGLRDDEEMESSGDMVVEKCDPVR
ncbi:hypothetical protein OPV22_023503 [Ensete ventricosum]|uniref:NPH3 domain-containing protein n=1 Tax=Ensete ventricosum TaxID=4639 RepID=A0AAV8PFC3_ENSVE|nr:hypothetical protein OPV22_023503 [Ensete ventricosum]